MVKPLLLPAWLVFFALHLQAQSDTLQLLVGGTPLTVVEDKPDFTGGDDAMYRFMAENIHYPVSAREKGIQGTVVVKFVVDVDSSLKRVHIVRSVGGGCDEEVIRLTQLMSDQKLWIPGSFN